MASGCLAQYFKVLMMNAETKVGQFAKERCVEDDGGRSKTK